MPIYEYVCSKCGRRTEVIQRVGEAPLKTCEHCGGRLKKAISAPAIQFKGSGWYVTDYAGKSGQPSDKAEKSEKGEASEKGEKAEKAGSDKSERAESSERSEKAEKAEKKDKKKEKKTAD